MIIRFGLAYNNCVVAFDSYALMKYCYGALYPWGREMNSCDLLQLIGFLLFVAQMMGPCMMNSVRNSCMRFSENIDVIRDYIDPFDLDFLSFTCSSYERNCYHPSCRCYPFLLNLLLTPYSQLTAWIAFDVDDSFVMKLIVSCYCRVNFESRCQDLN